MDGQPPCCSPVKAMRHVKGLAAIFPIALAAIVLMERPAHSLLALWKPYGMKRVMHTIKKLCRHISGSHRVFHDTLQLQCLQSAVGGIPLIFSASADVGSFLDARWMVSSVDFCLIFAKQATSDRCRRLHDFQEEFKASWMRRSVVEHMRLEPSSSVLYPGCSKEKLS
eukprot:scaffold319234_cov15-Tisochrysis_lutea.AAC.1